MNNDGFTHNYALYQNTEQDYMRLFLGIMMLHGDVKSTGERWHMITYQFKGKKGNFLSYRILEVSEFKKRYKKKLEE